MRSARALWLLPLALSCGGSLFNVEVERSADAIISQGTIVEAVLGDLGFDGLADLDLTTAEEIENAGAEPGDIDGVFVTRLHLQVVDPPGADMSFIDRIDVFVEAPGLERVEIASSEAFGAGVTEVDLDLEDVDLTDYVVSTSMTVSLEGSGRRPDTQTRLRADIVLDVGVTRAGACKAVRS